MNKIIYGFLFYASFYQLAFSEEVKLKIWATHFPPYVFETTQGGSGAMYDVVKELSKRLKIDAQINFAPWARIRYETENNPNVLLIPLARTLERENKYTWVLHVFDDPYVLVKLKNSSFDISSIKGLAKLKIGYLKGSVGEELVKKYGLTHAEPAGTDVLNAKKLKEKRIDAWIVPLSCRGQYRTISGIGEDDLEIGVEFLKVHEYVGASKSLDSTTVKKWQKSFDTMKKDGSYSAILKKYGLKPLP